MREIGSEFWKPRKQHIRDDERFFLSGRTALDVIVKDAKESYGITSALLPSYCCHTMIEPFHINGIKIRFYDVYIADDGVLTADIQAPIEHEMLYIMKYFGDTDFRYVGDGYNLSGWATTVEDLTHSCFSLDNTQKHDTTDYWFTSYRKWFAVAGIAIAGKRNGMLLEATRGQYKDYVNLKNKAYNLKYQFMNGESAVDKKEFLDMFREAEVLLSDDFRDYGVGCEEIYSLFQFVDQIDEVRSRRRKNAQILIDGLSDVENIKVFTNFQDNKKCPLFVPVIVEDESRDALRKYLVDNDIYSPIHWPILVQHTGLSDRALKIYNRELSLVCDQRYREEDMKKIVKKIVEFYKE